MVWRIFRSFLMRISLGFDSDDLKPHADALAKQYGFDLDGHILPRLQLTSERLVLLMPGWSPLWVDFNTPLDSKGKKSGLLQAIKPHVGLNIVDATAGWGRDAFSLALSGAHVVMLERKPWMAALLQDGLARIASHAPLKNRLRLHWIDAMDYFNQEVVIPDVVYLDPMHPLRQKSALVKKDMQALQQLIGVEHDALALLQRARTKARVVVKWPQRLPGLLKPDYQYHGKTVRFDVYQKIP